MLSLVGGGLVTLACLWLGWSRCCWYGERTRALSQLCGDLARMESELRERETETETLLALLAQENIRTADLYRRCLLGLRGDTEESLAGIWKQAVQMCQMPLRAEEGRILQRVGQVLGRYTGQEQAALLAGLRQELEGCRQRAKEEGEQQGRIAVILGLTLGLTLAVVLG